MLSSSHVVQLPRTNQQLGGREIGGIQLLQDGPRHQLQVK